MQQFRDVVWSPTGRPISHAEVAVTVAGTNAPAVLFSDNGATILPSNAVEADEQGEYTFYAANGRYILTITATGYASTTRDIILLDPADPAVAGQLAYSPTTLYPEGSIGKKLQEDVSAKDKDFGAKGDGVTDDAAAIQAAIDCCYAKGGGVVHLPLGRYVLSATLTIPQRVVLQGETASFVNQFGSGGIAEPLGSVLFAAPGLNADVVRIECRLYVDGGLLRETTHGRRNQDARHGGGMRDITVWGNRSVNAAPSEVELNNAGHGIHIRGARYVTIENVISMFCGDDGLRTGELDYGTGLFGVNNASIVGYSGLSNNGSGMYLSIGDSRIDNPNCGYNGAYGIIENMSNSVISGGLCWNNVTAGVFSGPNNSASVSKITGLHSYDNDGPGFQQGSSGGTNTLSLLIGCTARGNGRNAALPGSSRSNFLIGSLSTNWHWSGCVASAYDQGGVLTSSYGFYVGTTQPGVFGADNVSRAATVSDYYFADPAAQLTHPGTTRHPGFIATSNIDLNGLALLRAGTLRFAAWDTITTIASNTITVNATNSLLSLNCAGPQTVSDLSFSGAGVPLLIVRNISTDAVTFTHNTAKLRCANGADLVLAQHEAAMFLWVSGAVWQQIGGAA